ncbi:MAG: hypothetical protein WCO25_04150, partial [Candidatus Uhrbacteria bacterium]
TVTIDPIGRVPRPTRFFTNSGSLTNAGWQAIRCGKAAGISADKLTLDDASRFVSQQAAAIRIIEHDDADITPEVVRRGLAPRMLVVNPPTEWAWMIAEAACDAEVETAVEAPAEIVVEAAAEVVEIIEAAPVVVEVPVVEVVAAPVVVEPPKSVAKAPQPAYGKYAGMEPTARPKAAASCAVIVQAAPAPKPAPAPRPAPALSANQMRDLFGLRRR